MEKAVEHLKQARRIVIKVGSALVAEMLSGHPHRTWMESLAEDMAAWRANGKELVLVSSGSVALGRKRLGLKDGALKLEEKQAAAACGQITLAEAWRQCFETHGIPVAQLLLTLEDSEDRRRYLNARNTLEVLLERGVIPIINENDTVATSEIRVGDNDRLAARVGQMTGAEMLVLLSDVNGLYSADPNHDDAAQHIEQVETISKDIRRMATPSATPTGTGGMMTKLDAAELATATGCHTVIALGTIDNPLRYLEDGVACTLFAAKTTPRSARKEWIAGSLQPCGTLVIDAGAEKALLAGNSLLPAGVTAVEGKFSRGDAVAVRTADGQKIARGLVAYGSEDARQIIGKNSKEIEAILGYKGRDALLHRDDMVLL